jgi:SAM-dependent methyltransferase
MNAVPDSSEVIDLTLASSLDSLDGAENYMSWIIDLMRPYAGGPVLELGAGHGTFTDRLSGFGPVTAVEPGDRSHKLLAERYIDRDDITPVHGVLDDVPHQQRFASAVMVNVLEHIDDDAGTLRELHRRLEPGGSLLIWVPAYQLLFSDFDRRLGHFRRYRRKPLVELVEAAGFAVSTCHHANLPGWFSWLLLVRLAGWEPTGEAQVQLFDRRIVPVVRAVESRVRPPFGQSLFLAATKLDH